MSDGGDQGPGSWEPPEGQPSGTPPPPPPGHWPPPPPPGQWPPPPPPGQWPPPPGTPPPGPPAAPGYPAGYQPPPAYGYGYGYAPKTEGMAVTALVLSIVSFTFCPLIPAIVALILGANARQKIRNSGGALTGESLVTAATIISWINIGLSALAIIGIVLLAVFSDGNSTSYNDSLRLLSSAAL